MGLSPQSGSVNRRLQRCEHLRGGAPARAHSAVHVPVPVRGRLRPRPVNPVHRLPERLSEVDERARSEHGHRAPRFHTSADQLNSTTSVGESASSPKKWANCCRTASQRSPADRRSQTRAWWPPMKPTGCRSCGRAARCRASGNPTPRRCPSSRARRRRPSSPCRRVARRRAQCRAPRADRRVRCRAACRSGTPRAGRRRRRTRCCRCCRSGRGRRRGRRRAPGCGPASAP